MFILWPMIRCLQSNSTVVGVCFVLFVSGVAFLCCSHA